MSANLCVCTLAAGSGALGPSGPLVVLTRVGVARLGDLFDLARARVDPTSRVEASSARRRASRPQSPVRKCAWVGVTCLRLGFGAQTEVGPGPHLSASAANRSALVES